MDRGQTPHDYLIGVSIMLVVLFGIFAVVPGIYEPFQEPVGGEEHAMADRIGERIVGDHSLPGTTNTLNYTRLETTMQDGSTGGDFATLLDRAGVPETTQVNVTLLKRNPPVDLTQGNDLEDIYYLNRSTAATSVRIVRFDDDSCEPVCRLVVRVW